MGEKVLDTVLLLALPASGKSEVRKYLEHLPADQLAREFHMGPNVQLDDFPYVHLMRRIDAELESLGEPRIFFHSEEKPFKDPRDWGTLIALLNEDFRDLVSGEIPNPPSAANHIFERLDSASKAVGAPQRMGALDDRIRHSLSEKLEDECRELVDERRSIRTDSLEGKTVVIEFARGGPQGSSMPLPQCFGYQYSLSQLSEEILQRATILYIWVSPEESRRKNDARTDPNDPGSILHHGVPIEVMLNDYGSDDTEWLESTSERPGTVTVQAHGKTFYLPLAKFDNRVDKTTFLREDSNRWKPEDVKEVHEGMKEALDKLAGI